ncbi:hypothetical protein HYW21_03300 [Candidatus Woesearchaeota archaeon]|nr:hypothetical protein [Candidatus Woesearchaeota archaeon]
MSKKKKGEEMQFHWIFILIIGAIILIFFVSIVQKQKSVSQTTIDAQIKVDLRTILTNAMVSDGKTFAITVHNTPVTYSCDGFKIGNLEPFRQGVMFAPNLLQSQSGKIIVLTRDWAVPFTATNFVYLTSPEIRYIFVSDAEGYGQALFASMPDNITKEMNTTSIGQTASQNHYKVRFIMVNRDPSLTLFSTELKDMPDEDVTALVITPINGGLEGYGTIAFYQKRGAQLIYQSNASYLSRESLLGAMYSDTPETYTCAMNEAFAKLSIVTTVLQNRTRTLWEYHQSILTSNCEDYYEDACCRVPSGSSILEGMATASDRFTAANTERLYQLSQELETQNKLVQLYSCPVMY